MPRGCTQDAEKHRTCLRLAYESQEAISVGVPQGQMITLPNGTLDFTQEFVEWQNETAEASTADKCGRCKRIRFGAEDFPVHSYDDDTYNTHWAFIPKGRTVCVSCSAKSKTKPKSSSPSPLADQFQQMLDMMEGMQHQIQQLVETNAEITADNQALQERVIKMSFALQHITTEVESLNNKQDKIQYMLQKKTGMSLEDLEPEYDAERDDPIWDEGPGKFINDEEEPESI